MVIVKIRLFREEDIVFFKRVGINDVGEYLLQVSMTIDFGNLFEGKSRRIREEVEKRARRKFEDFGRLEILSLMLGSETGDWAMDNEIGESIQEMRRELTNF